MASGSNRGAKINGLPFQIFGDANVAFTPRVEKESLAHSGGNATKETLVAGSATGIKLVAPPTQYKILEGLVGERGIPLSVEMRDGSVRRTTGEIKLGDWMTEDFSCEVEFLTDTGEWTLSAAS